VRALLLSETIGERQLVVAGLLHPRAWRGVRQRGASSLRSVDVFAIDVGRGTDVPEDPFSDQPPGR
jgi:hypothetical protein